MTEINKPRNKQKCWFLITVQLIEARNRSTQTSPYIHHPDKLTQVFDLRFVCRPTCVDFGRAQIRTQVSHRFNVDRNSTAYA